MKNLRINVIGSTGVGKSTLARALAQRLNVPYIEMDALYWEPNWTEPPDERFFPKLEAALSGECWVLDGNFNRTRAIKWKRVTHVVWIDASFPRTLFQSVVRALKRIATREELWPGTGNRESVRKTFFSRGSILLWMLQHFGRVRRKHEADLRDPALGHIRFVRLRTRADVRRFLQSAESFFGMPMPE